MIKKKKVIFRLIHTGIKHHVTHVKQNKTKNTQQFILKAKEHILETALS